MCGIAGILNLTGDGRPDESVLMRMLHVIRHRGPDDDGVLLDGELAMGMRRLSIIDLSSGKQPIWDESGRHGVVFNGEIYNYRELRQELLARGHQLRTHSDTEVIVHLYEERQEECLQALRGMFGIAVWDQQQRRLFLARDRLGIKPLYYTQVGNELVFASEIKAILQHPAVTRSIDWQSLGDYLSLKYIPAPRTLLAGIHSLPPGHWLISERGRITIKAYWDLPSAPHQEARSQQDLEVELEALLQESVRLRLRSDVPFGAFLSGGIDSSLIVSLMQEQLNEPVKTFSVGFDGRDELPYARQVANRFRTDHHELRITAHDFRQFAEQVIWHLDQPIADQATIATYMLAHLASQHVKMVLTGEGGDELFAGYARYAGERWSPWFRRIPGPIAKGIDRLLPLLPGLRRPKIAMHALLVRQEADRFADWFPLFDSSERPALLADGAAEELRRRSPSAALAEALSRCQAVDPVARMLYVDTKLWLPDYLLLRGDKLTMAHSLEARVPLLDHKLCEFAARLPMHHKLRGRERKYLLKQVARRRLPATIIDRKKQGFPIPIDRWLRDECRDLVNDLLNRDTILRRGLFCPDQVAQLMHQHQQGFADHSTKLWGLASLEQWLRQFVDGTSADRYISAHDSVSTDVQRATA